jgi:hypothetical protein
MEEFGTAEPTTGTMLMIACKMTLSGAAKILKVPAGRGFNREGG